MTALLGGYRDPVRFPREGEGEPKRAWRDRYRPKRKEPEDKVLQGPAVSNQRDGDAPVTGGLASSIAGMDRALDAVLASQEHLDRAKKKRRGKRLSALTNVSAKPTGLRLLSDMESSDGADTKPNEVELLDWRERDLSEIRKLIRDLETADHETNEEQTNKRG
ncbi:hypothetical protein [Jiella marina]|uniref:hypothetical protein n=1 Tax=Jiella sp. LLJ827 TaxID=2917712 RepID=UPI0021013BFA|nr:hypothetical protein [Jiella sp. LLJ827]MCQ0987926.1 hypothetical protein [Jiella sp. LLJ827]